MSKRETHSNGQAFSSFETETTSQGLRAAVPTSLFIQAELNSSTATTAVTRPSVADMAISFDREALNAGVIEM